MPDTAAEPAFLSDSVKWFTPRQTRKTACLA
nr:MAG TPA: hypothetical protein [Caudoviricetes sp.]